MSSLADLFHAEISRSGPISFRDFMARALYDPQHGYYASGRARIGRNGDYITNVSVGPLFGKLLARQFLEMWELLGRPNPFDLVEQGANDGTLAADVVGAIRRFAPECPVRLSIVEPFDYWRMKQSARSFDSETRWFESADALPEFVGVHFSNELPDAFPVHLLHRTEDGWRERFVSSESDRLVFIDRELSSPGLRVYVAAHLPDMPVGTVTEVNLDARHWIKSVGRRLRAGFVLVIDYGVPRAEYYATHRTEGTLEAIADHRRESDPLARPGEIDLTAHVDFTSLAEAAKHAGLRVAGFTDQHHFLVGLSRLHFAEGVQPDPSETRAFQTLSHPTMLGRAFKVLCLEKMMDLRKSAESTEGTRKEVKTPSFESTAAGHRLSGFVYTSNPRDTLSIS
jgi:SAM-dependent MidA family methyltransferase